MISRKVKRWMKYEGGHRGKPGPNEAEKTEIGSPDSGLTGKFEHLLLVVRYWIALTLDWFHCELDYWANNQPSMELKTVSRVALYSRIFVLILQIIGRACSPEHVNGGFKMTEADPEMDTWLDIVIEFVFGGVGNSDGQYFLHISKEGYTDEKTMAYFPLLPLVTRTFASCFCLSGVVSYHSRTLLAGWLINTWFFRQAAMTLHELALFMDGGKRQLDFMVSGFFICNPATIFFTAFYSESMFAWLTFSCILALYQGKVFRSAYFAAFGALCRLSGLLNFGIIAYFVAGPILRTDRRIYGYLKARQRYFRSVLFSTTALVPFLMFQYFCVSKFCWNEPKTNSQGFYDLKRIPLVYLQGSIWDVGSSEYFQVQQIPNIILVAPILGFIGYEFLRTSLFRMQTFASLGLGFPVHGAVFCLSVFCFLFVHAQDCSRIIMSACPYAYLYMAGKVRLELNLLRRCRIKRAPFTTFLVIWFILGLVVGTVSVTLGY